MRDVADGRAVAFRWAAAATAGAAAVAAVLGTVIVRVAGDPATATTTSSMVGAPPVQREEASLVDPSRQGVLYRWNGVEVTAEELLQLEPADVPDGAPVVIDPRVLAAQSRAGVDVTLLRLQVRHLAARLLPVAVEARDGAGGTPFDVAVVAPPTRDGRALDVPLMVFNTADRPRRLTAVEVRILGPGGDPVTERVRFFDDRRPVLPARTAYFNTVTFASDQVLRPGAAARRWAVEGTVTWDAADASPASPLDAATSAASLRGKTGTVTGVTGRAPGQGARLALRNSGGRRRKLARPTATT